MSSDGAEKTIAKSEGTGKDDTGNKLGTDQEEKQSKPSLLDQTTSASSTSEWLRDYFSTAMGLTVHESLLDEVSFEGIARYIQSDKCQKIVTLAGAGISTSAGIPDFRSPDTGVYAKLEKLDIPDPKMVFDLDYFKEHPDIVYSLRKELFCGNYEPTPCHYFVKLLHSKKKLHRHFTQNIDGLDLDTGLDPDAVVQAHGTCLTYHCMKCEHAYTKQYMSGVLKDDDLKVPLCEQKGCDGVIRPDIVFFGESLPARFGDRVSTLMRQLLQELSHLGIHYLQDVEECDMMIILGTSLVVQPFATLTSRSRPNIPRLYINLENTGTQNVHPLTALMFGGGFDFGQENNIRDVFWQGTCDDGCYALAKLLGWDKELKTLVEKGHAEFEKKFRKTTQTSKPQTPVAKAPVGGKATNTAAKPNSTASVPKFNAKNNNSLAKPNSSVKPSSASKSSTGAKPKTISKSAAGSKK